MLVKFSVVSLIENGLGALERKVSDGLVHVIVL